MNKYPLLEIDKLFDHLRGVRFISKINLNSRQYQLRIRLVDLPKMTFWLRYGHYEFMVMTFGLTIVIVAFMNLINRVFGEYLDKFLMTFECTQG